MTINEFLKARLDEDLMFVRATTHGMWEAVPDNPPLGTWMIAAHDKAPGERGVICEGDREGGGVLNPSDAAYIARYDPWRMLAEIEAKRNIVDLHRLVYREVGWLAGGSEGYGVVAVCRHCVPRNAHYARRRNVPEGPCLTLRYMAAVYAAHTDYRQEWAA